MKKIIFVTGNKNKLAIAKAVLEKYDIEIENIDLDVDIPEEAIIVNADKKELRRAISNLLVNAYKHNPDGIHVLVKLYFEGKKVQQESGGT